MKYGEILKEKLTPEWKTEYLDYASLKGLRKTHLYFDG